MESHPVFLFFLFFYVKILQKDIAKLVEITLGKKNPKFPQFLCRKKKTLAHPVCHVEICQAR